MQNKDLEGYEGIYSMDKDGNIFSPKGKRKPILHETGYYVITLSIRGKSKTYRYHRLVAETWIPNPENKPFVNHKDGNKLNFHPENLEWTTEKENSEHAVLTGLFNVKGVNNPACRFTESDVSDWYFLITQGVMIKDIAKSYGCGRNAVKRLLNIYYAEYLPEYKGRTFYRGGYYNN